MQRVAVLLSDELTTRRLRAAFGGECLVDSFVPTDPELHRLIVVDEVLAAIVDLRRPDSDPAEPEESEPDLPGIELVATLHQRYPSLPIVAYLNFNPNQAREILWVAHAGASEIILREYDDLDRIAHRIMGLSRLSSVSDRVFAQIAEFLPADVYDFVRECLANGHRRTSIDQVAARLKYSRKTIGNRLRARGLPAPHRIVGWTRVLVACRWLDDPHRSVEKAARDLRFVGAGGLRSFIRRYLDCGIEEMRERGGFLYAVARFREELNNSQRTDEKSADWLGGE